MVSFSIGARRKLALPIAVLATATALVGAFAPAAFADDNDSASPAPAASMPYTPDGSYTCDGTTETLFQYNDDFTAVLAPVPNNPAQTGDAAPLDDLTKLFGERNADLLAGAVIPLYASPDLQRNAPPACALRLDTDAVSGDQTVTAEWIYCTDKRNPACVLSDANGKLVESGSNPGAQQFVAGNSRISADQELVVSYLLQHDFPLAPIPAQWKQNVELAIGAPEGSGYYSSNENSATRAVRQTLVWCVTDTYVNDFAFNADLVSWCNDMGLGPGGAGFNQILSIMNTTPSVDVTVTDPASGEVEPGGAATFEVTTATPGMPVTLNATSGTLELVSPAGATLVNGTLTFPAGVGTAVVKLTGADAGTLTLSGSSSVPSANNVAWSQSPDKVGAGALAKMCQVFATTTANGPVVATGEATVTVLEDTNADATADANGADADANGAAGAGADANGAAADANGAAGAGADANAVGAASAGSGANATASANATTGTAASASATSEGTGVGAKGGLANTGSASPFVAGAAALVLLAAGAGALALRRREQH